VAGLFVGLRSWVLPPAVSPRYGLKQTARRPAPTGSRRRLAGPGPRLGRVLPRPGGCPASRRRRWDEPGTRGRPGGTAAGRPGSSPPAPATHSAGADHPACRNPQAGIAVQETGRCGFAGGSVVTGAGLDVRDLAQIPGGHLGAGLPEMLRAVVLRRYEGTHRTPRSSSSPAIRRPAGPGPAPRGAGHQHKPAHKGTPQRPPASSPAAL